MSDGMGTMQEWNLTECSSVRVPSNGILLELMASVFRSDFRIKDTLFMSFRLRA
jgi:hypothetical protein